jgi:hypothetical protein
MFLVLATADEDKPMLSCYISKELADKIKCRASSPIREVHTRRWRRSTFATAGGKKCRRYSRGIKQGSRVRSSSFLTDNQPFPLPRQIERVLIIC